MQYNNSANNSKTVRIKRLFKGKASIRDYLIQDLIKQKLDLIIECEGQSIYIPNSQILKIGKRSNVAVRSKFNNQTYTLIDFPFNPQPLLQPNQYNLFGGSYD